MPYANKEFIEMTLQDMLDAIKRRPDFDEAGMVACHIGVVRSTSKDGSTVKGLEIEVDRDRLDTILLEMNGRKGIIEVAVHLFEGYRSVSQEVMFVVVAGDIREHVFPVLEETVARIKQEVTRKKEFFVE
jgi:molybdopterin synthase catalytic subunit